MSYMAIISRIHTRPLPGADKLLIGSCESSHGMTWLKNKAYVFGMLEGYIKDSPEYIDEEEAS